jgi:predicted dehydrogenase
MSEPPQPPTDSTVHAGVIGVGNMGRHHARVYAELAGVELAGVCDQDRARADEIASRHGTAALDCATLLERVDVVTVAVPTPFHDEVTREAIAAGVDVLVEKPFVADPKNGRRLADLARREGVTIQVGHVERFNPAVEVLADVLADADIIAVDARRLGPPADREVLEGVVTDLMIHDVDVVLSLLGSEVETVQAAGTAGGQHATATLQFTDGVIANFTASRVTQQKVRDLSITAEDYRVNVDYLDRSVEIHRHSLPAYVEQNGDVRYRQESIVERPAVPSGEPLKKQLSAFVEAATTGRPPVVGPDEALEALNVTREIHRLASRGSTEVAPQ